MELSHRKLERQGVKMVSKPKHTSVLHQMTVFVLCSLVIGFGGLSGYLGVSYFKQQKQLELASQDYLFEQRALEKEAANLRDSLEFTLRELQTLRRQNVKSGDLASDLANEVAERQELIEKRHDELLQLLGDDALLNIISKEEKKHFHDQFSSLYQDINELFGDEKVLANALPAIGLANNNDGYDMKLKLANLGKIELRQRAILAAVSNTLEHYLDSKTARLKKFGLNEREFAEIPSQEGVGGPYIEATEAEFDSYFARHSERIELTLARLQSIVATEKTVPLGRPITNGYRMSSKFGLRKDPINNRYAMHAGLDFAAKKGTKVIATAQGKIIHAGWRGGYGKMVEIDHGNGFITRYAHLSKIDVKVGQVISNNQLIGRVGNTGRSTGAHLHYEVRRKNKPINPKTFVNAKS